MEVQRICTAPETTRPTRPAPGAPPPTLQLAEANVSTTSSVPERRLPYPVMNASELVEEFVRYRILTAAHADRQSETGNS